MRRKENKNEEGDRKPSTGWERKEKVKKKKKKRERKDQIATGPNSSQAHFPKLLSTPSKAQLQSPI
jgi:hypothetical protein